MNDLLCLIDLDGLHALVLSLSFSLSMLTIPLSLSSVPTGNDHSFYDLAERLRQRIVDIKIKIERQLRILNALKTSVKDQVIEMQRMEVRLRLVMMMMMKTRVKEQVLETKRLEMRRQSLSFHRECFHM